MAATTTTTAAAATIAIRRCGGVRTPAVDSLSIVLLISIERCCPAQGAGIAARPLVLRVQVQARIVLTFPYSPVWHGLQFMLP